MMREVAATVWRTVPGFSRAVDLQVGLPLRWGGMGLRPLAEVAPAAFLGSWAQALPAVQRLIGGPPLLGSAAPDSPTLTRVQDAEHRWRELAARPTDDPVDWAAVVAEPTGLRRQQRILSQAIDRQRWRLLQAAASRRGWGRVQSCSGVWAGVWLTLPPTEHGLSFLDCEYAALARFRLGLPLDPEGGPCRHGGGGGRHPRGWYDPEGEHASSCLSNSGTRTQRHNQLRDELRRQLKWLGFWAETEQSDSRLMHRPDVRTFGFSLRNTFLEVTVTHPSERRMDVPRAALGTSSSSFLEAIWRNRLRTDYGGGPPPNAPFDLIPAMVSTYGGWHPAFAQWWRGVVRTAAERSGTQANPHAMLWRTVGFLSVTLQRQQFQVLAGCAPTLADEVTGRLGNPLSETPEFWRAAPEAAVDWSAEELDLPPPPRLGEAEEDLVSTGLLRASGLRL